MHDRSESHFTLFGVSTADNGTEIFTNRRLAYILQSIKGAFLSRFYAPVANGRGELLPLTINLQKSWDGFFTRVSRKLGKTADHNSERLNIASHWEKVSSKIWDEENLYKGEGLSFRVRKSIADAAQFISHHRISMSVTTAIGAGMAFVGNMFSAGVTFLASPVGAAAVLMGAVGYSALHRLLDIGLHSSLHTMAKNKHQNMFQELDAYATHDDVSDYFKIKTPTNIKKLCPKMDMSSFDAEDFTFLTSLDSGMLADHQTITHGMQPESLKGHLLAVHQRGFSSNCTLPDKSTRVDVFQSKLCFLDS